jgi:hypothetical protein
VHQQTAACDKAVLEVASFFIPMGWLTKLKYVKSGIEYLRWRRGVAGAAKVSEEVVEQVVVKQATKEAGQTVLGHYPEYFNLAKDLGARRFNIPTAVWEGMDDATKWGANQKFLDRMILRGDNIRLATPLNQVRPGSFFQKELKYLFDKGYKVGSDGLWLIK